MMLGLIILVSVGILLLAIGYMIWKKEKITLLHDYHYDKVTEEDKKEFCALSGKGIVIIGVGLIISAVFMESVEEMWSFLPMIIGFAIGLGFLIYAGYKYNR